jgi:hypothetical protein
LVGVASETKLQTSVGAIAHKFDLSFNRIGGVVFLRLADLSSQSAVTSADFIKLAAVIPVAYRPRKNTWVAASFSATRTSQAAFVQANGDLWLAAVAAEGTGPVFWAAQAQYQGGEVSLTWISA